MGRPQCDDLADLLRTRRQQIIAAYAPKVRSLSPARELSHGAVVDHVPMVLDRIASIIESSTSRQHDSAGRDHAVDRLGRGFELEDLIREYGFLREAIFEQWEVAAGDVIELQQARLLDYAFDQCFNDAAREYLALRGRVLDALNRLSDAAFGPGDLDSFLNELIRITIESMEDVHTAAILLTEGDRLHLRATGGLEKERISDLSVSIGEGFAGRVAALRAPISVRNASEDDLVRSSFLKERKIHALYGVPLHRNDELLGIAYIGSLTANEFSEDDRLLFNEMAQRAASIIAKSKLLAETRRAAVIQQFLADTSRQLAETLDYKAIVQRLSHLAVPTIADWCIVDLLEGEKLVRASVAHSNPEREAQVHSFLEKHPMDPNRSAVIGSVVQSGRAVYAKELQQEQFRTFDEAHQSLIRELQLSSYIVAPIVAQKRVMGTLTLVMAESGRRYEDADVKVAEELARRVAMAMENARLYSEAQSAIQLREQVLAVVSHDMRNQLDVFRMSTSLLDALSRRGDIKSMKKPIEALDRTALNMRRLVDDLLDMAALQSGRISIVPREVDLKQIIEDACEPQVAVADAKGVQLECPAVESVEVQADPERVLQVLGNLLGNAVKFCRPGDSVKILTDTRPDEVLISVRDSGPGIPQEDADDIFLPYHRGHGNNNGGTGLGLYIAKGIIEEHGGRIWFETRPEGGTTFSFTLRRPAVH